MRYRDYEEFIAALNAHDVRYLIAGAHAVAYHGTPRATKDLDVYLDPEEENAKRTLAALAAFFGGAALGYEVADLTDPNMVVQIGVAPVRIDLLASLDGIPFFAVAWERRVDAAYGPVPAHYLSLDDLLSTKEAADRPQDRADIASLRKEGLTIGALAETVGIPEHRLRPLINDHLGFRNFAAFVNDRRIGAAKRLLRDPGKARLTVAAIAYDLGFGSLGPFNRAFKEATGVTPTEFRKTAAAGEHHA